MSENTRLNSTRKIARIERRIQILKRKKEGSAPTRSVGNRQKNDTNQTNYSYTELKLKKSATFCWKSTENWYESTKELMYDHNVDKILVNLRIFEWNRHGKLQETYEVFIYWYQIRNTGTNLWEINKKMTRIKQIIHIETSNSKNPSSLWEIKKNGTNPRKISCNDLNLDKILWVWESSNKIDMDSYANQTEYSYTDFKLEKSASLWGKARGK